MEQRRKGLHYAAGLVLMISGIQASAEVLGGNVAIASQIDALPIVLRPLSRAAGQLKRCWRTPNPAGANGQSEIDECEANAGAKWTLAFQAEKNGYAGQTCAGAESQSLQLYPFGKSGPAIYTWDGPANQHSLVLKQDYELFQHPCGGDIFNWNVLMRHIDLEGGALPSPAQVTQIVDFRWKEWIRENSERRVIAAFQGFWNNQSHLIEINLYSPGWSDAVPQNDDILVATSWPTGLATYIVLNSTAVSGNLIVDSLQQVEINWLPVLENLVARGLLPRPAGGWPNSVTQALAFGFEYHNKAPQQSGVGDMEIFKFEISSTGSSASIPEQNDFDSWRYVASNPDLISAIGIDISRSRKHYYEHGFWEGRARTSFDCLAYEIRNSDLKPMFHSDCTKLTKHWIEYGYQQGRSTR
ncbi:MAG TPA: hypothetical protein VE954_14405 [Oligoflexus sp.]|uniref:hypothetical protein n=1 Tax=Oligoflexus sp. TaxID=1971216 RepID=UPI002D356608|nr:hypothetical protein [Oligoflexus sp.]HYX34291.1 hypothetical protein [Oligoflexus sp.]